METQTQSAPLAVSRCCDSREPHPVWSTDLCDCCAEPGYPEVCIETFLCPTATLGDIHEAADGLGGFYAGCTPALCCLGGLVAASSIPVINPKEPAYKACIKSTLCCTAQCYWCQVARELRLVREGTSKVGARVITGSFHPSNKKEVEVLPPISIVPVESSPQQEAMTS
mmetsp:Transcript_57733/g.137408  ORF Transcript_57733/g.137408 Transcript_57733/m.137408 type:complete len:169 (-) Transcript_57733:130-636(-)|eukprot:CAMPEP_0178416568 /NCGR_PEP_ID=MMETSP0689_2-20121128/24131_1 /TAXON_ID=160604 /ORGANISM="Amphidinium massartii, Strain CS-259" /LENGTH=168 /DNA_ID=CAMNT_0020037917 /DNA_START=37 /DNA_END=543 /DNA_ORIENTATION=-